MSNVIDSRIVEMKFDNKQFESAASTSLGTLAKLKESLNFEKNGTNFLANLSNSLGKLDLSGLTGALEGAGEKFSALEQIAVGAFRRIGEQGVDWLKNQINSLSLDQIKAGWEKYGEMTKNVATIMSATGDSMDVVSGQMEKLLYFTDETSYNFTDMANNIGKFTANGIKLDSATSAMEGIATWAAKSGQNAETASRVMYNLAQAIGMGALKLQDWKSVELANMGTQEFKQMAIQAGIASGTLKKVGDKVVTVGKNTAVTVSNFRETLAEGWLDTKTLMGTLNEYGKAAELISDIHDATGLWAADMMDLVDKQRAGELSTEELASALGLQSDEIEKNKALIDSLRSSIELLASDEYAFSLEAYKAGQEARTLGDAIDAVKDAVSSGWMTSFQWLFGEYDKSKKLWTDVAESLLNIFNAGNDARNSLLADWGTSNWEKLEDRIKKAGGSVEAFEEAVGNNLEANGKSIRELEKEYGSLAQAIEAGAVSSKLLKTVVQQSLEDIISGNKGGSLQSAEEKLQEVQEVVNKVWSGSLGNGSERKAAIEEMGYQYEAIQKLVEKGADYQLKLEDISDLELKNLGLTEQQIAVLREIEHDQEALSNLEGVSGRQLFAEAILSGLSAIEQHLRLVKEMWHDVFGTMTGDRLKELTAGFRDLMNSFALYDEETGELNQRGENLVVVLKKIFEAAKNVGGFFKSIGGILGQFGKAMSPAISAARDLGLALLDLFNEVMPKINEFIGGLDFSEQFGKVSAAVTKGIEWITKKVDELREKVKQTDFAEKLSKLGEKTAGVRQKLKDFYDGVKNGIGNGIDFQSVLEGISNGLKRIKEFFQPVIDKLKEFWKSLKGHFDFSNITSVGDAIQAIFGGIGDIVGGAWRGLLDAVDRLDLSFGDLIKTFIGTKIAGKFLTNLFGGGGGSIKKSLTDFIESITKITDNFGEKGLLGAIFGEGGLGGGKSGFDKFADNIKKIGAAMLMAAGGVMALGLALLVFNVAVKQDPDGMGMLAMAAAMTTLVAVLAALSVVGPKVVAAGAGLLLASVGLLAMGAALLIFNKAVKQDPEGEGILAMAAALYTVTAALAALGLVGPSVILAAGALLIAAVAVAALAGALALFSLVVKMKETTTGLIAMFVVMALVVGSLMALSTAALGSLAGAAALLVVSVALIALAGALALFTAVVNMDGTTVALIAMAAALGVVVVALAALSAIGPMVLVAAGALALAAVAIVGIAAGLAAAGVALAVLGAGIIVLVGGVGVAVGVAIAAIGLGIGKALEAIGNGIGAIFAGIGEGIGTGIAAIGTGIAVANEAIGVSVESLGTSIGNAFQNVATGIAGASGIIGGAFDALSDSVGDSIEKFGEKVGGAIEGVGESISKAGDNIAGVGDSIAHVGEGIASFSENVKGLGLLDLIGIGAGLIEFSKGVKKVSNVDIKFDSSNVVEYVTAIGTFATMIPLVNTTASQLEARMRQLGQNMSANLAGGLNAGSGAAYSAGSALGQSAYSGASRYSGSFYNIGVNMAQGMANGIRASSGSASAAAGEMAKGAADKAASTVEVKSPSRVFARIGGFMALGLAKGIKDEAKAPSNATERMVNNAVEIAAFASQAIADAISSQDDSLTITPVLDLTNIQEGTTRLSNMLAGTQTAIGVTGNLVSAQQASQNGGNAPQVVSIDPASLAAMSSGGAGGQTIVHVNFEGTLAQLASVLQPAIAVETNRVGINLVNE